MEENEKKELNMLKWGDITLLSFTVSFVALLHQ